MKIIKTIVTSIDIINAADCYRPPMDVAMEYLQTKYKGGKCDFGCFISQITKILEVSAAVCDKTRNQGRMLMNVRFEAECYVFTKGEILANFICEKFIALPDQRLPIGPIKIGEQHVGYVNVEKVGLQAYKEGMSAPVIVKNAEYTISQPATISAIGFQPIYRNPIVYKSVASVTTSDAEYLRRRLEHLKKAAAVAYEGPRLKQYKYFKKMLSLSNSPKEESFDLTKVDVATLLTNKSVYFTRPINLEYGCTSIAWDITEEKDAVVENFVTAMDTIINQTFLELSSLENLMAYSQEDLVNLKSFIDGYRTLKKKDI
jgi:hypothetical protein